MGLLCDRYQARAIDILIHEERDLSDELLDGLLQHAHFSLFFQHINPSSLQILDTHFLYDDCLHIPMLFKTPLVCFPPMGKVNLAATL